MTAYSRGTVRRLKRPISGRHMVDMLSTAVTRVGKQSKFGPKKGSTPPGFQGSGSDGVNRR